MQSAKEKLSNMASSAKENVNIYKAKAEEKVEKAGARTEEEKRVAEESRKAKEAEAKMELHAEKGNHAAEKLSNKYHHNEPAFGTHAHQPVGTAAPMAGTAFPTYPLGGHRPGHKF